MYHSCPNLCCILLYQQALAISTCIFFFFFQNKTLYRSKSILVTHSVPLPPTPPSSHHHPPPPPPAAVGKSTSLTALPGLRLSSTMATPHSNTEQGTYISLLTWKYIHPIYGMGTRVAKLSYCCFMDIYIYSCCQKYYMCNCA